MSSMKNTVQFSRLSEASFQQKYSTTCQDYSAENLKFSYAKANWKEYSPNHSYHGFVGRKILAIPAALIVGVIRTVSDLWKMVRSYNADAKNNGKMFKAHIYCVITNFQHAFGLLTSIVSDKLGTFLCEKAKQDRKCYHHFMQQIETDRVIQGVAVGAVRLSSTEHTNLKLSRYSSKQIEEYLRKNTNGFNTFSAFEPKHVQRALIEGRLSKYAMEKIHTDQLAGIDFTKIPKQVLKDFLETIHPMNMDKLPVDRVKACLQEVAADHPLVNYFETLIKNDESLKYLLNSKLLAALPKSAIGLLLKEQFFDVTCSEFLSNPADKFICNTDLREKFAKLHNKVVSAWVQEGFIPLDMLALLSGSQIASLKIDSLTADQLNSMFSVWLNSWDNKSRFSFNPEEVADAFISGKIKESRLVDCFSALTLGYLRLKFHKLSQSQIDLLLPSNNLEKGYGRFGDMSFSQDNIKSLYQAGKISKSYYDRFYKIQEDDDFRQSHFNNNTRSRNSEHREHVRSEFSENIKKMKYVDELLRGIFGSNYSGTFFSGQTNAGFSSRNSGFPFGNNSRVPPQSSSGFNGASSSSRFSKDEKPQPTQSSEAAKAALAITQAYKTMGLPVGADPDTVKKKYRELMIKLHPDKTKGDPELLERCKTVNDAYEILTDK